MFSSYPKGLKLEKNVQEEIYISETGSFEQRIRLVSLRKQCHTNAFLMKICVKHKHLPNRDFFQTGIR